MENNGAAVYFWIIPLAVFLTKHSPVPLWRLRETEEDPPFVT